MNPKKISTIQEMEREYNEGSTSKYKNGSNMNTGENRFMTAYSRNSQSQVKERKNSLVQKKRRLQDEVRNLKNQLERKREMSMSRSKLSQSRKSVSRLAGSGNKGFKNAKKIKNNKMLIEEIKK